MATKSEPLFYIARDEQNEAGPYDIVQMAGLLRKKIITPETPTRLEGEEAWKPLSWQPQFIVVREMPPDAVSTRVTELDDEAEAAKQGPIPLPSRETMMRLAGLAGGALFAGVGAYLIASVDKTTGQCLAVGGCAAAAVGQCMILAGLLDEDFWTLMLVFFVPLGDIYYLICNFERYFKWICAKYVGTAVAIGAATGMGSQFFH
jgi:hypothetical protein